jgi:hypothetical protein
VQTGLLAGGLAVAMVLAYALYGLLLLELVPLLADQLRYIVVLLPALAGSWLVLWAVGTVTGGETDV